MDTGGGPARCCGQAVAWLAVSKRTTAVAVALALVIGGAIGFAWHAPGHSTTWADIRTWVGFAIVIIGATIALSQMDMQRRQLASQQRVLEGEVERNKRRDALLDGQLRELEQRALTFERQQAEEINTKRSWHTLRIPGSDPPASYKLHAAEVANSSLRPIRNAACRIEPEPCDSLQAADKVGLFTYREVDSSGTSSIRGPARLAEGTHIPLIPAGETGAFAFAVDTAEHPEARITVRFTDDAGLHWQADPDLHLEKLDGRDW